MTIERFILINGFWCLVLAIIENLKRMFILVKYNIRLIRLTADVKSISDIHKSKNCLTIGSVLYSFDQFTLFSHFLDISDLCKLTKLVHSKMFKGIMRQVNLLGCCSKRISLNELKFLQKSRVYIKALRCSDLISQLEYVDENVEEVSLSNAINVNINAVRSLLKRCRKISKLDFSGIHFKKLPLDLIQNLKSLNIKGCKCPVDVFAVIIKNCPLLENLNLRRNSTFDDLCITDKIEWGGLSHLKKLNLSYGPAIDDKMLQVFTENIPSLVEIDLTNQKLVTDLGIEYLAITYRNHLSMIGLGYLDLLTDASMNVLATCCHGLQTINILIDKYGKLTEWGLVAVVEASKQLKKFRFESLKKKVKTSSRDLQSLCTALAGCGELQTVQLSGPKGVYLAEDSFALLTARCPLLAKLSVALDERCRNASRCTVLPYLISVTSLGPNSDQLLSCLPTLCPDLRELRVHSLTSAGLKQVARLGKLQILTVSSYRPFLRAATLSECGQLRALTLTFCPEVTNAFLLLLSQYCQQLTELNLSGSEIITDAGRLAGLPLRRLDLSHCTRASENGLITLVEALPSLLSLGLRDCPRITNIFVECLATNCEMLQRLDLSHCPLLTDEAVRHLEAGCPDLRRLRVEGCAVITDLSSFSSLLWRCKVTV